MPVCTPWRCFSWSACNLSSRPTHSASSSYSVRPVPYCSSSGIKELAAIAVLAGFENEEIAAALAPENGRAGGEHGCLRIESQIAVGKLDGDDVAIAFLQRRFDHPALGGVEIGDRSGGVAHSIPNANSE